MSIKIKYDIKMVVIFLIIILIYLKTLITSIDYFYSKKNDNIYNVFYINLLKRKDRKKELLKEFKKFNNKDIKINIKRIDAIKHKKGQIGCAKSHIKCLKYAKNNNLEKVIICEDDINFNKKLINEYFKIIKTLKEWDVIILSGHGDKQHINSNISKALGIVTTGLYIVKKHYYDKLINNFEESVKEMENRLVNKKDIMCEKWCIDINWKKLQKTDNWFIFNKTLGYQRTGYSDIENRNVDYRKLFA